MDVFFSPMKSTRNISVEINNWFLTGQWRQCRAEYWKVKVYYYCLISIFASQHLSWPLVPNVMEILLHSSGSQQSERSLQNIFISQLLLSGKWLISLLSVLRNSATGETEMRLMINIFWESLAVHISVLKQQSIFVMPTSEVSREELTTDE